MRIANMKSNHGRNRTTTPDMIVIHALGEFIDTEGNDYYAAQYLEYIGLSAHALISPSGIVIRTRNDDEIAWHAKGFNSNSLGVEVLVPGLHTYHTFSQAIKLDWVPGKSWDALLELVDFWLEKHKIKPDKIFRHSDLSPDRKIDPGLGFRWEGFLKDLQFKGEVQ